MYYEDEIETKQNEEALSMPVDTASIATNPIAQLRKMARRKINEDKLVHYIGEFYMNDQEVLEFKVSYRPRGKPEHFTVDYRQRFFTG